MAARHDDADPRVPGLFDLCGANPRLHSQVRGAEKVLGREPAVPKYDCGARGVLHCQQPSSAGHINKLQAHNGGGSVP